MSKGQLQGQPDWAKFGLEPNERQPLNPSGPPAAGGREGTAAAAASSSTAATATPAPARNAGGGGGGGGGDLFGGQVQSANELFADDQVRQIRIEIPQIFRSTVHALAAVAGLPRAAVVAVALPGVGARALRHVGRRLHLLPHQHLRRHRLPPQRVDRR